MIRRKIIAETNVAVAGFVNWKMTTTTRVFVPLQATPELVVGLGPLEFLTKERISLLSNKLFSSFFLERERFMSFRRVGFLV